MRIIIEQLDNVECEMCVVCKEEFLMRGSNPFSLRDSTGKFDMEKFIASGIPNTWNSTFDLNSNNTFIVTYFCEKEESKSTCQVSVSLEPMSISNLQDIAWGI